MCVKHPGKCNYCGERDVFIYEPINYKFQDYNIYKCGNCFKVRFVKRPEFVGLYPNNIRYIDERV